jgi:hypothetical protein
MLHENCSIRTKVRSKELNFIKESRVVKPSDHLTMPIHLLLKRLNTQSPTAVSSFGAMVIQGSSVIHSTSHKAPKSSFRQLITEPRFIKGGLKRSQRGGNQQSSYSAFGYIELLVEERTGLLAY